MRFHGEAGFSASLFIDKKIVELWKVNFYYPLINIMLAKSNAMDSGRYLA
jgi:hypothetical protein